MSQPAPAATKKLIMDELDQRHHSATTFFAVILGLSLVLIALSLLLFERSLQAPTMMNFDIAWRITVAILGVGAVVFRRTRFTAMRLQDIAGVGGFTALFRTLENTTRQVGFLALGISVFSFVTSLYTRVAFYTWAGSIVAIFILAYAYPIRRNWQRVVDNIQKSGSADDSAAEE